MCLTVDMVSFYRGVRIKINSKILIYNKACPLFVPMIEEVLYKNKIIDSLIKMYFKPVSCVFKNFCFTRLYINEKYHQRIVE